VISGSLSRKNTLNRLKAKAFRYYLHEKSYNLTKMLIRSLPVVVLNAIANT